MNKSNLVYLLVLILLCGCSKGIPSQWSLNESKDPFTDEIAKSYDNESSSSPGNFISVGCSRKNSLNFYIYYPSQSGVSDRVMPVTIRIDNDQKFQDKWYSSFISGKTRIPKPTSFYEKIKGRNKLSIEILGLTRSTFDITGIDSVVEEMKKKCNFNPND